jgi:hypothetical protein
LKIKSNVLSSQSLIILSYFVVNKLCCFNWLQKIISQGARKVLVFGVALDGCRPISVTMESANKSATYDRFGCVKDNNDFCNYHNVLLQEGLKELREQHPDVQIVYGDLYNAMQSILDNSQSLGECFSPSYTIMYFKRVFECVVVVAVQSVFCSKIHLLI